MGVFGYCHPVPAYRILQSILQLISFFGMSVVLCLSLYSTLVSVNQAYFGNRLMTAGPNGFELAKSFYMDRTMVRLRHKAVTFLARALILLLLSAGGMLYVKFSEDQDVEAGYLSDDEEARVITNATAKPMTFHMFRSRIFDTHVHPAGLAVLL